MPASTSVDPISSTLKRSFALSGGSKMLLEEGLESALTKRSLLPVAFDPPSRLTSPGPLKHYIILNGSSSSSPSNGSNGLKDKDPSAQGVAIPRPKITFYRQEDVRVGYRSTFPPGAGMMNVGNTCYLNSTLQALFHTPALLNYLSDGHHRCGSNGGYSLHACTICALSLTLKDTHRSQLVRPSRVYEKLKTICKHLVHGRQEDAHEFLRYLIESLQKSFLMSVKAKALDNASKETTPFNQIFGGYMRQDVTCVRCKYVSTTFQHFMDLLLDIRSASNIEEALAHYFRPEKLGGNDGSNMYKCEKCKVKVPAQKSSFIERPPVVLCIQLKRFALTGGKISKSVMLSRKLEISRFVRGGARNLKLDYQLVSMITHVGPSPNCGHYTAIGEASNGQFYQFDDSHVRPVPVSQALNTASYVVMYEMTQASHSAWTKQEARLSTASATPSSSPSSIAKMKIDRKPPSSSGGLPASNGTTLNGSSKSSVPPLLLPKKLVPYDELDSSTEEDEKVPPPPPKPSTNGEASLHPGMNGAETSKSSAPIVEEGASKKPSSGFLPISIALKQQQQTAAVPSDAQRPSASGTWRVVDMEHHNPSIHSDNSSGSGGHWKIHSVPGKRPESDSDRSSSWSIKQTNSDSEPNNCGASPKKMKKMSAVKEAFSNTFGRFFPKQQAKAPPQSSNGSVEPSNGTNGDVPTNGIPESSSKDDPSSGYDQGSSRQHEQEDSVEEKRQKKRKKSFSNGFGGDEVPFSKKHVNSESRWNSEASNGGGEGVVDELLRQSSISEKVTSWNGGKSSTFSSSYKDSSRSRSDDSRDRYDEEMDRGRVKKIKRRHSDVSSGPPSNSHNGGMNPFQMAQQNGGGYHHNHRSPSFKDYNGRHPRRPFYHNQHRNNNNLRHSLGGSFDEGKFRKGGGGGYRSNDYHHRSRR